MTRIGSRYYTDAEMQDIDSYVQEKERLAKIEVLEDLAYQIFINEMTIKDVDHYIDKLLGELKENK